jgi:short-subunit dehydrogenase
MKIIILGATSGLGRGTAELFAATGHTVGIAGRRKERLEELQLKFPSTIIYEEIDVTHSDFVDKLELLIQRLGGCDLFLYSSGVGKTNFEMEISMEQWTNDVNIYGFVKSLCFMFQFFEKQGLGHIAAISSVAGFRGIGGSSAYSASKGYQRIYLEAMAHAAKTKKINITYSTIIPGFVDTEIIAGQNYPLTLSCDKAVQVIYKGLLKRKRFIYVDGKWRYISALMRIIPSFLWERMKIK